MLEAESGPNVDPQAGLVVLHGEDVVAPRRDDLLGQVAPAEDPVADDLASHREDAQQFQFQGGLVLVRLGIDGDLAEHGASLVGVGDDEVLTGDLALAAASQGLAVQRDLLEGLRVDATGDPAGEDRFQLVGVEASEGGGGGGLAAPEAEGVGERDAVLPPEPGDADQSCGP